ncbi:unnamed protein product [Closterium sp. NIES-53]
MLAHCFFTELAAPAATAEPIEPLPPAFPAAHLYPSRIAHALMLSHSFFTPPPAPAAATAEPMEPLLPFFPAAHLYPAFSRISLTPLSITPLPTLTILPASSLPIATILSPTSLTPSILLATSPPTCSRTILAPSFRSASRSSCTFLAASSALSLIDRCRLPSATLAARLDATSAERSLIFTRFLAAPCIASSALCWIKSAHQPGGRIAGSCTLQGGERTQT